MSAARDRSRGEANAGITHPSLPALLRALPRRASASDLSAAALHRQLARHPRGADRDPDEAAARAHRSSDHRLRIRLGRAFLLREEYTRDLPPALVQS